MIIALGHKARVGKDSVAGHLNRTHGYTWLTFAGPLKRAAMALFDLGPKDVDGSEKDTCEKLSGITPREAMQNLSDVLKGGYGPNIFARLMKRRINAPDLIDENIVISDLRYFEEAHVLQAEGAILVRVDRDDAPEISGSGHSSEHDLDDWDGWDAVISARTGGVKDLCRQIDTVIRNTHMIAVSDGQG